MMMAIAMMLENAIPARVSMRMRVNSSSVFEGGADRSVGVDLDGSGVAMATRRRYSRSAGSDVKSEMHRYKRGTAKSGPGGKAGKAKNPKQAIAIGLSKARKKGRNVPARRT
jgi:hypothetical protein